MNIIIPMAGEGKRFEEAGYSTSKPIIPTIDRRSGRKLPMVVCATKDLPEVEENGENVVYIDRSFHKENGAEELIKQYYNRASFITVEELTKGQACTCLLAKSRINNDEELLIAGCDNGMEFDKVEFDALKLKSDVIAFTYRHNQSVLQNPDAYGWYLADEEGIIKEVSIKKAVSDTPMEDHAVVATFWFKKGSVFVEATEKMIAEDDRINNEFYVDQVIKHAIEMGLVCRIFDIERYIGWGTPKDLEAYHNTLKYWEEYCKSNGLY